MIQDKYKNLHPFNLSEYIEQNVNEEEELNKMYAYVIKKQKEHEIKRMNFQAVQGVIEMRLAKLLEKKGR